MKLILASASSRRKELLEQIGFKFQIIPSGIEEITLIPKKFSGSIMEIRKLAEEVALKKCEEISRRVLGRALILGADTVVTIEGEILGKPKNRKDAEKMLNLLSGRLHHVITGIALIKHPQGKKLVESVVTEVKFRSLEPEEIKQYIKSGEPMDKAGAYGIQGRGAALVQEIQGCYFNVVGLPLSKFVQMAKMMGFNSIMERTL